MNVRRIIPLALLTTLGALAWASESRAEGSLEVTVNKAQVVTVNGAAGVVLVANPQIADVVVEQNRLVFVVGKHPGETRLYIYSKNGTPLLERDVVVTPERERAVTIVRDTRATHYSCAPNCVAVGADPAPANSAPAAAPAAAPMATANR